MDAEQNSGPVSPDETEEQASLEQLFYDLLEVHGHGLLARMQRLAEVSKKTIMFKSTFSPYNAVIDVDIQFEDLPKPTAN